MSVCLPASQPAVRPSCARCMALEFQHCKVNHDRFTKSLFQRTCAIVLSFILYYLAFVFKSLQIGVNELVITSAACIISIILAVAYAHISNCTPKQIDLQAFLSLQLPYCVSMLLLTSPFFRENTLLKDKTKALLASIYHSCYSKRFY